MKKIESLTPEQKAKLPTYAKLFTDIGLATHTDWNKPEIEKWMAGVYKEGGLEPPKIFIYLGSPFAGAIGSHILTHMQEIIGPRSKDQVRAQVWDQVRDQVDDQVWDQVMAQVDDQVWDQVGAQVRAQVWDQVRAQVRAQVRDQVDDQVRAQVRDQVRAQVWDQVRDQVDDQVWDQVMAQVRDQVRDQVWDQVDDQVRDQVRDQVWDQLDYGKVCWGQHDANWLAFYSFFLNECSLQVCERIVPLTELTKHVGWFWPFKNAVIITPRPSTIHRNARGRLHNQSGPALTYLDGFAIHAMNGVRFSGEMTRFVTTPAHALLAHEILDIKNVEQRGEAIKKFGPEKLFEHLRPKKLDSGSISGHTCDQSGKIVPKEFHYDLFEIEIHEGIARRCLRMSNPSVENDHPLEWVDPNCNTFEQALLWRNTGKVSGKFIQPQQLT